MSDNNSNGNSRPEKFSPHSVEAEEAVLGSILINPDAILEIASFLQTSDFFIVKNAWVWDAILESGREFDVRAAGMLALDVARIEAGLLLTDVDYISSKKALIESQKYSPYEIGLGRLVDLEKENFIGRSALITEQRRGPRRKLVGLEVDWTEIEACYQAAGLAPQVPSTASRIAVPVYRGRRQRQTGKATSTTWSPTLKKMIALASVASEDAAPGTALRIELTVEAVRHTVKAVVVPLPFFKPPRKTATPPFETNEGLQG